MQQLQGEVFRNIEDVKKSIFTQKRKLSTHIATRLYRSPEVIVYEKHYYKSLDIWSAGVIMGDLFRYICMGEEPVETNNNHKNKRSF
jgi:serine/threonine protein kinase